MFILLIIYAQLLSSFSLAFNLLWYWYMPPCVTCDLVSIAAWMSDMNSPLKVFSTLRLSHRCLKHNVSFHLRSYASYEIIAFIFILQTSFAIFHQQFFVGLVTGMAVVMIIFSMTLLCSQNMGIMVVCNHVTMSVLHIRCASIKRVNKIILYLHCKLNHKIKVIGKSSLVQLFL